MGGGSKRRQGGGTERDGQREEGRGREMAGAGGMEGATREAAGAGCALETTPTNVSRPATSGEIWGAAVVGKVTEREEEGGREAGRERGRQP